jgi:LPXTG-site transpeptidase (sortase) family protein
VDLAADPERAAAKAGAVPEAGAGAGARAEADPGPAETVTDLDPSAPASASKHDVRSMRECLANRGRRAILPVVAALLAAVVAGTGYLMVQTAATGDVGRWTGIPASAGAAPSDAAPFAVPVDGTTPDPFATGGPAATGLPTRLRVAAIGVDTALETLRTGPGGELTAPKNFAKAGWYAEGTLPGDTGPAVIAGHVDSRRGPAVFYKLRRLERGDRIEVVRGGRTLSFTVTSTAWYPKDAFPTEEVYGPTPDRQLRLITCGGVFDQTLRSYKDNLVVYAVAG